MGEVRYPFVKQMVKKVLRDSKIVAAPVNLPSQIPDQARD